MGIRWNSLDWFHRLALATVAFPDRSSPAQSGIPVELEDRVLVRVRAVVDVERENGVARLATGEVRSLCSLC